MPIDIELVIDTQVLVDASNPNCENFLDTSELLDLIIEKIKTGDEFIAICVDARSGEGKYDLYDIGKNESMIVSEYINQLGRRNHSKDGWRFLSILDKKNLILPKPKWPRERAKKNKIYELISERKQTDRILLGVTCSTTLKTLISDEEEDFTSRVRKLVKSRPLRIHIVPSDDSNIINILSKL